LAINEIWFLLQTPLTKRDYDRLGTERLLKRGFRVKFLDLTAIINPKYLKTPKKYPYEGMFEINNKEEYVGLLKKQENDIFVIDVIVRRDIPSFVLATLNKYGIPYANLCVNSIPIPNLNSIGTIYKLKAKKIFRLFASLIRRLSGFFNYYNPDFIFAGGEKDRSMFPKHNKNTKIIWGHTLDYDLYLEYLEKGSKLPLNGKYAVFLDEYFPLHPDFHVSGAISNPYKEPSEYYDEMNAMFEILEKKTGIPIVIAAHPRSDYNNLPGVFQSRKIYQMKTVDLVANAEFVIAHGSTSVNFAVLFEKPIIFIMPSKVKGGAYESIITNFAGQFGKTPYTLDSVANITISDELMINEKYYYDYKNNYIKKAGSPNKYLWEIVADAIQSGN